MTDINNIEYGERLGYSEMFEWGEKLPIKDVNPLGKLVQFDPEHSRCIIRAKNTKNIVGITTINTSMRASNPDEWPYKYILNEFGDLYLKADDIVYASKEYDSINEFSYLSTYKKTVHIPLDNPEYDKTKNYIQRSNRLEWATITIFGKAILEDNGECKAGEYCTLYSGDNETKYGTVVPAQDNDEFKLYVLERLSDNTVLVFFTPQIYSNLK